MRKGLSPLWRVAFFMLVAFTAAPLSANSLLISPNPNPGEKFPVQGDCAQNNINPADPHIDVTRSTWSCSGASSQMIRIFYREGPQSCVYIDNFNNDGGQKRAFFVPLQSSDEWLAFTANLPGGVNLRYGCMGQIVKDSCGNNYALPDSPASDNPSDVVHITTNSGYSVDYVCPLTSGSSNLNATGGCGTWQKVKEEGGSCTSLAPATPVENPGGLPPASN